MKMTYLSAVAVAATLVAGTASAVTIDVQMNVAALGAFTADTGSVATANTITTGAPLQVGFVQSSNIGAATGQVVIAGPGPDGRERLAPCSRRSSALPKGRSVETLTVTSVDIGTNALGVLAVGTITQTVQLGATAFTPTTVYWSAAYTQNAGPGTQINAVVQQLAPFRLRFRSRVRWRCSALA